MFLRRESVDDFDKTRLLGQVADEVTVVPPPRQTEVSRPVRAWVWRCDVDKLAVRCVWNHALCHWVHVCSNLHNISYQSVVQCCCPRGKSLFSRTNLQVRVLRLQVLVFVLVLRPQVLVLEP